MKDQEFSDSPGTGALPARPGDVRRSPEHGILAAGAVLAFTYVGCLAATYFSMPEHFQAFVGLPITHIFFGRAAGISLGYALDYGFIPVVAVNLAIETVEVLLFYPMFVLSVRRFIVIDMLARLMERMHRTAEANQALIRRWGIPGLFCFVFIPFWMTGPLIGSVIGYLLGLRTWVNMTAVLGGTWFAILVWAGLLGGVQSRLAALSPLAPLLLVVVVIGVVVLGWFLGRTREASANDDRPR